MARNWPLTSFIADFTQGPPNFSGANSVSLLASQTANRKITTSRGRQYELDQVQTGVLSADLTDQLEYLNPSNKGTFKTLLANGTFESGITPWTSAGGGTISQSSTQKHSGTFSLRMVPDGVATQDGPTSEAMTVVGGQTYTVTSWHWFTNAVTANFDLAVGWFDYNNTLISFSVNVVSAPATTWTQFTNTFTAPLNAAFATVVPILSGTPVAGQIWYTDDVTFIGAASPTAPWNTGGNSLLPYRCTQYGAWWNTATKNTAGNLLNSANYVPGSLTVTYDPSFETTTSGFFGFSGAPTITTSTTQHFDGAKALSVVYTTAADNALMALYTAPNVQYTFSIYVFAPASHTVQVRWNNYPGGLGSLVSSAVSSTTGAWQRLTLTGTPNTPFSTISLTGVTGTLAATFYFDAMQLELGSSASAFGTTGPTYFPVYTGYIERYPQTWDSAGFRGIKPLECVDALSPLSRAVINQSYPAMVLGDSPHLYIPYNDASLPQKVQLPVGGSPGTGTQILGTNSGTITFGGDTFLDSTSAVAMSQVNVSPPVSGNVNQVSWLGTYGYAAYLNPSLYTFEIWYKASAGTFATGAAAMQPGESMGTTGLNPQRPFMLYAYSALSEIAFYWTDDTNVNRINTFFTSNGSVVRPDNKWHHVVVELGFISGNYSSRWAFDGGTFTSWNTVTGAGTPPGQIINNFFSSVSTYFLDTNSNLSLANAAYYPSQLTQTQVTNHYNRGTGYSGELSGVRAARILNKYWSSNIITANGETQMSSDFHYDPVVTPGQQASPMSVLSALQEVASTEGGLLWVDARGFINFDARDTRYLNAKTAQYVFGENAAGGELPYEEVDYDYDPTYVYSEADLTADSGVVYTSVNAASQTAYGQRILSQQMFMANDWDVQQAANFFTQRYAVPPGGNGSTAPLRINRLTINPGSNPNLWTAALSLDIGERITVTRRTAPGTIITGDYYIEQVSHSIDGSESSWIVSYQLSPVFNPVAWLLGDSTYGVLGTTTVTVY